MKTRLKIADFPELTPREARLVIEYVKEENLHRAAKIAGISPAKASDMIETEKLRDALNKVYNHFFEEILPDAEWLLYELLDNHRIARHQGNISASNTALKTIMNHNMVNAAATQKIDLDVQVPEEVVERLKRGRQRVAKTKNNGDDTEISFL